ncbi:hypothetical protein T01_8138, partial [Trichinella spiralis]
LCRCEIVIGQRIRLTVSRMVMECFVKAVYVVLISIFSGFSLQAERERDGGKFKMLFADVFVEGRWNA